MGLLVSLTVLPIVLVNASSHFYSSNVPDLAIGINPSNPDARIRLVELAFADEKNRPNIDEQRSIVKTGIRFEPNDARLYSLLGTIEELAGEDTNTVQSLYIHALTLDPTDLRALLRRYVYNVSNGRIQAALDQAELIFRAWPQSWDLIEASLPALLADEAGYQQAYERFLTLSGGPRSMLISLSKSNAGLAIAKRLLIDWHNKGVEDLRPAINVITSRLVQAGQPLQAFLLFGLTLNSSETSEAGFVFNPGFALDPNGNLFDWSLPRVPGISAQVVNTRSGSETGKSESPSVLRRHLEIKFQNTPVRIASILQTVRLPGSNFTWSITYSTDQFGGPKPLQLQLKCRNNGRVIETVDLTASDDAIRTIEVDVSIPASDCDLQQIVLTNGKVAASWQNRYSGSIALHALRLQPSGS